MRAFLVLLAMGGGLLVLAGPAAAQSSSDLPVYPLLPFEQSAAVLDDIRSSLVNPALLGTHAGWNSYVSWLRRREDSGRQIDEHLTFLLGYGSFSLGYRTAERSLLSDSVHSFSLNKGFRLSSRNRLGIRIHWDHQSGLSRGGTWGIDLGWSFRPMDALSIGVIAKDLNTPRFGDQGTTYEIKPNYQLGIGIRPGTERLTFAADLQYFPEKDLTEERYIGLGYVTWVPVDGLHLSVGGTTNEQFFASARIWTSRRLSFGAIARTSADGNWLAYGGDYLGTSVDHETFMERKAILADLRLAGSIEDGPVYRALFAQNERESLFRLHESLETIIETPSVAGVLLTIEPLESGLIAGVGAHLQEIRATIRRAREEGKVVVAYLRSGVGPAEYYLASACDEIVMPQTSVVGRLGLSLDVLRWKGLFENFGIDWETLTAGENKSALNPLAEGADASQEAMLQGLVESTFAIYAEGIAADRDQLTPERVRTLADQGFFLPQEAVDEGLIDFIGNRDFARDRLFRRSKVSLRRLATVRDKKGGGLVPVDKIRFHDRTWDPGARIGVIHIEGPIVTGGSSNDFLFGQKVTGSSTVTELLRRARTDGTIRGVILRIDSPGGDATAADEILEEVRLFQFANKPIVVSFGDVAASGGYWIGCAGDRVLAQPLTITGSIGVISQKPVFGELFEWLDVERETYKEGEHADADSPYRPRTDEEQAQVQRVLDYFYDLFVQRVAVNRGLSQEEVRDLADGRLYTGAQALEVGLIDGFGGLHEATTAVQELAAIDPERPVTYVLYRKRRGFFVELLSRSLEVLASDME